MSIYNEVILILLGLLNFFLGVGIVMILAWFEDTKILREGGKGARED